jgi:hypothetical protein
MFYKIIIVYCFNGSCFTTSGVELRFSRHSPDWRVTKNFYSPNQRKNLPKIMSLLSTEHVEFGEDSMSEGVGEGGRGWGGGRKTH